MSELTELLTALWDTLSEMAPYLLFGFFFAGLLSVFISPALVERHLGGAGMWPVVKAAIFGVPLPLCSCGVIPVAASLRRHGATRGATTAFLISTPQTGVDSIFVTFSLLGPVFAVFRPLAALVNGIFGGAVVSYVGEDHTNGAASTDPCTDACCTGDENHSRLVRAFHYGFVTLAQDIGKPLLVGLVIAALISALVPQDFLSGAIGSGIGAMLIMMVVGIPVYVCATASVPIAAALIQAGVSPGAALVFLMTGPATNAAAVATIWKIMGRRTAGVYLATVAVTAIVSGLALDYLFGLVGVADEALHPRMLPTYVNTVSAVVLLAVLGHAILRRPSHTVERATSPEASPEQLTLTITGMTCSHCAATVERALSECPGVRSVHVDLKTGRAEIAANAVDINALSAAVTELGYGVSLFDERGRQ